MMLQNSFFFFLASFFNPNYFFIKQKMINLFQRTVVISLKIWATVGQPITNIFHANLFYIDFNSAGIESSIESILTFKIMSLTCINNGNKT